MIPLAAKVVDNRSRKLKTESECKNVYAVQLPFSCLPSFCGLFSKIMAKNRSVFSKHQRFAKKFDRRFKRLATYTRSLLAGD